MKTKNGYLFYLLLLATMAMMFTINSCKKDTLVETPTNIGPYNTLLDFYSQNGVPMQTFTINPTIFNIITGNQGTVFSVSANTLLDTAGATATGNVRVQLMEIYSKQSIVLSNKTTTSLGQVLKSAGEFYIKFDSNGIQYLPISMQVDMPNTNANPGIKVFYGDVDNTTGGINWINNPSPVVTNNSSGYHFSLSNSIPYNWVNCSFVPSPSPQTNITVSTNVVLNGTSETVTINLFLAFKTINSAMGTYNPTAPDLYTFNNVPEGKDVSVVGIGVGKFTKNSYFARLNTIVVTSQSLSLTLIEMPAEQIKTELQNL